MRLIRMLSIIATIWGGACLAQVWEIGGAAGGGFTRDVNATGPAGTAAAGLQPGVAFSAVAGQTLKNRFGGELRYTYQQNNLRLSSGGTETTFRGNSHAVHYDLLWHFGQRFHAVNPFVAAGGGIKLFRGTGAEAAWQPLDQFAYLTHTQQWEPLISAGGGVKIKLGRNLLLRAELRDYVTPFPDQVITPAPGVRIPGWLHTIVPLVGISYSFYE